MSRNKENHMSLEALDISKEAAAARSALAFADAVLRTPPTKNFHRSSISLSESNKFGRFSRPTATPTASRPKWRYATHSDSKLSSTSSFHVPRTYRKPPVPVSNSKSRHQPRDTFYQFETPQNTKYFSTNVQVSKNRLDSNSKYVDRPSCIGTGSSSHGNDIQIDQVVDKSCGAIRASQELQSSNSVAVKSFSQAHKQLLDRLARDTTVLMSEATEFTTRATARTLSAAVDNFQGYNESDLGDEVILSSSYSTLTVSKPKNVQESEPLSHSETVKALFSEDIDPDGEETGEATNLLIGLDGIDDGSENIDDIEINSKRQEKDCEGDMSNNFNEEEESTEAAAVLALAKAREVLRRSVSESPEPAWYTNFKEHKDKLKASPNLSSASTTPPPPPSLSPSPLRPSGESDTTQNSQTLLKSSFTQTSPNESRPNSTNSPPPASRSAFVPVHSTVHTTSTRRQWFQDVVAQPSTEESSDVLPSSTIEDVLLKFGDVANSVHSSFRHRLGRNLSQDEVNAIMKTAQLFSSHANSQDADMEAEDNYVRNSQLSDEDETKEVSSFDPVRSKLGELEETVLGMNKRRNSHELAGTQDTVRSKEGLDNKTSSKMHSPLAETAKMDDEVVEGALDAVVRAAQRVSRIESISSFNISRSIENSETRNDGCHDEAVEEFEDEEDGEDEDILRNALKEKNWSIHTKHLNSYTVFQIRSLACVIKQWHAWSCERKDTSSAVVQCRGRILRKRRKSAIRRWYLWTQAHRQRKDVLDCAAKHHQLRLLLGGPLKSTLQSKRLLQWHRFTQAKLHRKILVDSYLQRKVLKNWKHRVVTKMESKLAVWRGSVRFEQRRLSCAMAAWRRYKLNNRTAKLNLTFFKARIKFPKSGLVAKCFNMWVLYRSQQLEMTLELRKKCFEALWEHVVTCVAARKLLRSRWVKITRRRRPQAQTLHHPDHILTADNMMSVEHVIPTANLTSLASLKPTSTTSTSISKPTSSTTTTTTLKPVLSTTSLKPTSTTSTSISKPTSTSSTTTTTTLKPALSTTSLKPTSTTPTSISKPTSSTTKSYSKYDSLKQSSIRDSTTASKSELINIARWYELSPLSTYHQRSAIKKWRGIVLQRKRQEESSALMLAAGKYYSRNLLKLVFLSWDAWPAVAERRAVKFWTAHHIRRLLWRWFSYAFDPSIREVRLVRMLRSSKGYSSSTWKESSDVRSSFVPHDLYDQKYTDSLCVKDGIDHGHSMHPREVSIPQPRPYSASFCPTPMPTLGNRNSYAEVHSVMTEIKALSKSEVKKNYDKNTGRYTVSN